MTDKIVLTDIANLQQPDSVVTAFNNNNDAITVAMNNTLSRDGTSPNMMQAQLDMNSNRIINLGAPVNPNDAIRLTDLDAANGDAAALAAAVGEAAASATAAATSAGSANTSSINATAQAANAATSATASAASASAAATSAAAAAVSASLNGVVTNTARAVSANYTVVNADNSLRLDASGSISITFNAASSYTSSVHATDIYNMGTRRISVTVPGFTTIYLFPNQSVKVRKNGPTAWDVLDRPNRRWILPSDIADSGNLIIYVDPSAGDDNNDGLVAGSGGAFKTILAAWNYYMEHCDVAFTLQLAHGATFPATAGQLTGDRFGGAQRLITILGDPTLVNPPLILAGSGESCLTFRDGGWASIEGVQFGSSGTGSIGLNITQTALADVNTCMWSSMVGGNHISVADGAHCNIVGPQVINGNAQAHWVVGAGGKILVGTTTIDGQNSVLNFSAAFIIIDTQGRIELQAPTFANCSSISGFKYLIQRHSIMYGSVVGGASQIPGSSAGTVDATSNSYV